MITLFVELILIPTANATKAYAVVFQARASTGAQTDTYDVSQVGPASDLAAVVSQTIQNLNPNQTDARIVIAVDGPAPAGWLGRADGEMPLLQRTTDSNGWLLYCPSALAWRGCITLDDLLRAWNPRAQRAGAALNLAVKRRGGTPYEFRNSLRLPWGGLSVYALSLLEPPPNVRSAPRFAGGLVQNKRNGNERTTMLLLAKP